MSEDKKEGQRQAGEVPVGRKRKRRREAAKDAEARGGKGQGWGATLQHVNLFSEAEREADKQIGQNEDHQREKQEQDLKAQQRSGLAPTPLGEGAAELKDKDSQPWYTQVKAPSAGAEGGVRAIRLGREVTGQEAEGVIKREEGRKGRADPMGSLFRSGAQPTGNVSAGRVADRLGVIDGRCSEAATREGSGSNTHSSKRKRHKKEHKHKKHKRKHSRGMSASKSERDGERVDGGGSASGDVNLRDSSETMADGTREQKLVRLLLSCMPTLIRSIDFFRHTKVALEKSSGESTGVNTDGNSVLRTSLKPLHMSVGGSLATGRPDPIPISIHDMREHPIFLRLRFLPLAFIAR